MPLRNLIAVRYVVPLREGGSLPAIVDTLPEGEYVLKFRGAGQGPKALVAEVLAAGIAEALGLPVPAYAVVELAEGFGMGEPDPEIQDLLRWSTGLNFGLAYISGCAGFDAAVDLRQVEPDLAADIVWFDALITNVDRTPRNPNLLVQQGKVWMIDHGASFFFHHGSGDWLARAHDSFPQIKDHILLRRASSILAAHERLHPLLTDDVLERIVAELPDDWLEDDPAEQRQRYIDYLRARLESSDTWLQEAEDARQRA